MPVASWSRIRTWRRCHRQFDYKYAQRLARRKPKPPLLRGAILHEMLDARSMKLNPIKILDGYAKQYKSLFVEERELYGDIIEDLRRIYQGYDMQYADDGYKTLASEEFVATDMSNNLRFIGYIDKRVVDQHGRQWIMDHKTGKNIPGADARYSDLQLLLYVWAYNKEHPTDRISGVIWDYVRTKPPTIPELLKKGGLSIAKNINTDYATYMQAIEDNDLDPADYKERLTDLQAQESPFFRRVLLPNPSAKMVEQVVEDFRNTAIECVTLSPVSKARNMTRDCSSCEFHSICDAELRGADADFIRKNEFIVKDPNEHGDQEEELDN
jgi:hypothetical protein